MAVRAGAGRSVAAGSLSATGRLGQQAMAVLSATGVVALSHLISQLSSHHVHFLGRGKLSAQMRDIPLASATLGGSGGMCAQVYVRIGGKGPTTNTAVVGPGAGGNVVVQGS